MVECSACGARSGEGARFCASCGARLAAGAGGAVPGSAQDRDGRVHRHGGFDGARLAARSRGAAGGDEPVLRGDAGAGRAPRRPGRQVHRRCGGGVLRRAGGPRGRRPAGGAGRGRDARPRSSSSTRSSTAASGSRFRSEPASTPAMCSPATCRDPMRSPSATPSTSRPGSSSTRRPVRSSSARRRTGSSATAARAEPMAPLAVKGKEAPLTRVSPRRRRRARAVDAAAARFAAGRARAEVRLAVEAFDRAVRQRALPPVHDPGHRRRREVEVDGRGGRPARGRGPR